MECYKSESSNSNQKSLLEKTINRLSQAKCKFIETNDDLQLISSSLHEKNPKNISYQNFCLVYHQVTGVKVALKEDSNLTLDFSTQS